MQPAVTGFQFLTRYLKPGQEPLPYTATEIAGHNLPPSDGGAIAVIGDPTDESKDEHPTIPYGTSPEEFARLFSEWVHRPQKFNFSFQVPIVLVNDIVPAVASPTGPLIYEPMSPQFKIPERRKLIALYAILQYLEAFHFFEGKPVDWEAWRQGWLRTYDPRLFLSIASYLIGEDPVFTPNSINSAADLNSANWPRPIQKVAADAIVAAAKGYGFQPDGVDPGKILFFLSYFPEFQIWNELGSPSMTLEYGNRIAAEGGYENFEQELESQ